MNSINFVRLRKKFGFQHIVDLYIAVCEYNTYPGVLRTKAKEILRRHLADEDSQCPLSDYERPMVEKVESAVASNTCSHETFAEIGDWAQGRLEMEHCLPTYLKQSGRFVYRPKPASAAPPAQGATYSVDSARMARQRSEIDLHRSSGAPDIQDDKLKSILLGELCVINVACEGLSLLGRKPRDAQRVDPMAQFYVAEAEDAAAGDPDAHDEALWGRDLHDHTEYWRHQHSPRFVHSFKIGSLCKRRIKIHVVHVRDESSQRAAYGPQEDLGGVVLENMQELMRAPGMRITRELAPMAGRYCQKAQRNPKSPDEKPGVITLYASPLVAPIGEAEICFAITGLPPIKHHIFKHRGGEYLSTYIVISMRHGSGAWLPVFRTEVVAKTLSPAFQPLRLPVADFAAAPGQEAQTLKFECMEWKNHGGHRLIAEVEARLLEGAFEVTLRRAGEPEQSAGQLAWTCELMPSTL